MSSEHAWDILLENKNYIEAQLSAERKRELMMASKELSVTINRMLNGKELKIVKRNINKYGPFTSN
jgi:hypothetical protein